MIQVFTSAADALSSLLEGKVDGPGCAITSKLPKISYLENGIKYYTVEVTSKTGTQYWISAYEKEAEDLYRLATEKEHETKTGAPTVNIPLMIPSS